MRHAELPGYESRPLQVPAADTYVPAITVEGLSRTVHFGEFVTGTVVVAPRVRLIDQPICVELLCAERLLRTKLAFPDEFGRYYVASKTVISNSQELKAGSRYKFAFSLPVPLPQNQNCTECNDGDFLIPPTVGGGRTPDKTAIKYSVIWFVKVSLVNRFEYTLRDIEVIAKDKTLPFVFDRNIEYEQSQRLMEGMLKKQPVGVLSVSAKGVHADFGRSATTRTNLMLSFVATKDRELRKILRNLNVVYSVQHVVRSRHLDRFGTKGVSTEAFENRLTLATHKIVPEAEWKYDAAIVSFDMELCEADFLPNYTTCLCTSTYEVAITLKHSSGSVSLNLPLLVSKSPPRYA